MTPAELAAPSLAEFILARIAEWETEARDAIDERERTSFVRPETATEPDYSLQSWPDTGVPAVLVGPELVLRQCEAFRHIVELHEPVDEEPDGWCNRCDGDGWPCGTMAALAAIWSDHPEFREEWAA